jgi:TolB-like protein
LRATEEEPLKNANHIIYRDQINKVANAIREIITSVRSTDKTHENLKSKKINSLDSLLTTSTAIKSIAVMPLIFKSQNSADEFLAQGFSEDLFSSLKQIKALRSSIHGLSNSPDAPPNIGNTSSYTLVLTGNMTANEDVLGIHLQLVQAKTGIQVWSGEYECERDKVFKLRPMIITQICETLSINLKDNERKSIYHQAEASPAAIEYYWKGRFHWRKRGNDLLTSLECFQKSVDLAPGFADGHAGIANACVLLGYYGLIPFQESIEKCKESALKALKIDPTVVEAYYALAYASLCYELEWPDSEFNFEKVFSINPNSITAPTKFKNYFTQIICNFEIAESEVEPEGSVPYFLPAYSLMHKGKFDEGLKVAKIAISKNEGSFMAHRAAGLCYLELGYGNEAIEALNTAAQLSNRHPWILFDLIGAYAINGKNEEAQSIMEESMERINNLPARINDFYFSTA